MKRIQSKRWSICWMVMHLCCLASLRVFAEVDLVQNGGFETSQATVLGPGDSPVRAYEVSFEHWLSSRAPAWFEPPLRCFAGTNCAALPNPSRIILGITGILFDPQPMSLSQDLNTKVGERYVLSYAAAPATALYQDPKTVAPGTGILTVYLGDKVLNRTEFKNDPGAAWQEFKFEFTAEASVIQLRLENSLPADAEVVVDEVHVFASSQPLRVIVSQSAFSVEQGGTVVLVATVQSVTPSPGSYSYQWYFAGNTIQGETNAILALRDLQASQAGDYFVEVRTEQEAVRSAPAHVTVIEPGSLPQIIAGPELLNPLPAIRIGRSWDPAGGGDIPSIKFLPGYSASLQVVVRGEATSYQWFHSKGSSELTNSFPIPGSTNAVLDLQPIKNGGDSGYYSVVVSNRVGSVSARFPFFVTVPDLNSADFGMFWFGNKGLPEPQFIFDTDGKTPMDDRFFIQCYAGPDPDRLLPVGIPMRLGAGLEAGLFGPMQIALPDVPPGNIAYVQAKAWASDKGNSYEEARNRGGTFGYSEIVKLIAGSGAFGAPQQVVMDFKGFHLQSPPPEITPARFSDGRVLSNESVQWTLTAEPGVLLLERKSAAFTWLPIALLTNQTGVINFSDSRAFSGPTFYRARRYE